MSELEQLLALFLIALILAAIARRVGAPYPVFLALGGAGLTMLPVTLRSRYRPKSPWRFLLPRFFLMPPSTRACAKRKAGAHRAPAQISGSLTQSRL
jgi:hypothetical protein